MHRRPPLKTYHEIRAGVLPPTGLIGKDDLSTYNDDHATYNTHVVDLAKDMGMHSQQRGNDKRTVERQLWSVKVRARG